jgi:hypothetical protein
MLVKTGAHDAKVKAHKCQWQRLFALAKPEFKEKYFWVRGRLCIKRVAHSLRDQISDLMVANDLRIAEFALEKDFIVTDVLRALSKLKHDKFESVFCGGTCLSKAYGLLERISEVVDAKVVQRQGVNLSQSQRRAAMSSLKLQIIAALESVGFEKQDIKQYARDKNSYLFF